MITALNTHWRISAIADDGARTAFFGTGLRAVLSEHVWVELDFIQPRDKQAAIVVATRTTEEHRNELPYLTVIPRCGNFITATAGDGKGPGPESYELFAVDDSEMRRDVKSWLARTSSGDPVGELARSHPDRPILTARKFELEYGDIAKVIVTLPPADDYLRTERKSLFAVDITESTNQKYEPGIPYHTLDLWVQVCAANAIRFVFIEGIIAAIQPQFSPK